jgi:hypothetical protein
MGLTVSPFKPGSRLHLFDSFDQCEWSGNVIKREVAIERSQVQTPLNIWMSEDRLHLRAEYNFRTYTANVERLNADPVACQNEPVLRFGPKGDGEHAAQPPEASRVPFEKSLENGFSITMRAEAVATLLQFVANFLVIVNLAVKYDDYIFVLGDYGLVSAAQIDDL